MITALLLTMSSSAFAQLNYVLNPDFEQYTFCPNDADQIYAAKYWHSIDTLETHNGLGKPEYCHVCATNILHNTAVPDNVWFYQEAHSGSGVAQVLIFDDETTPSSPLSDYKRDYLQGRLYKGLTAGKSYCVSFYVNLEEASAYAVKEIGAYLDNGTIDTTRNCSLPQTKYTPQVINTSGYLTDTAGWKKIEGSFIATGKEQFITIGNFKDKSGTSYVSIPYNAYNGGGEYTWYLVDDVSVIESSTKADAGPDTHCGQGDSVYIGRPREIGLECTWTKLGSSTIIGTGAGIWVKPTVTTSYVVTQTLCGVVTKDTVRVDVWKLGITSIHGQTQDYSLSPNPTKGSIILHQQVADDKALGVTVSNALGAVVYSGNVRFKEGEAALSLDHHLPSGFYTLRISDGPAAYYLKLIKE